MKDYLDVSPFSVELRPDDGSPSLGSWPWPGTVPRSGDLIEHDGAEYAVTAVRWSTQDPRQVEVRVRAR